MASTLIIVNGAARGGRGMSAAAPHIEALRGLPGGVHVVATEAPGHAAELARQAALDARSAVVAAGGDGTVHEVVNGLLADGGPGGVQLGILPVGTGNSFVRDLGLADPASAVGALQAGHTVPVDAVRLVHEGGELHFLNLASFGFSAQAGALTNRRYKWLGAGGYVFAVLECLVGLSAAPLPHACDDGPVDASPCTLVSFCNSRFTGGDMKMAPDADIADGQLDVVRIGAMGRRRFLSSFPRIFAGTHPDMAEVSMGRARRVRFQVDRPVDAMIDGEVMSIVPHTLEVQPAAIRVFGRAPAANGGGPT